MKAIILAAGDSTRMYPLTLTRPKPLIPVVNKPIIERNLDEIKNLVDEVIIIIGYKEIMIKEKLGNNYNGLKLSYIEQEKRLGTGHALLQAEGKVKGKFLVMNGDDLYSKDDIKNCLKYERCVLGKEVKDAYKFGVLEIKNNKVIKIIEKPKNVTKGIVNTGLYVMDDEIFKELKKVKKSERGEIELTEVVKDFSYENVNGFWFPITYPWDLLDINEFFVKNIKKDIKGEIEDGVTIKGNIILGKNSVIKRGSYIEGPIIIGENCEIGPNCYVRAYSCLGNDCKIGNAVEVKNTIIMNGSKVPHLSYVGDSILGENINFGAGTITANLRHDKKNIKSMVKDELIDTNRIKFGTVIGDNVHTGINTMIYPGRKIWANKDTLPGEIVKKDLT